VRLKLDILSLDFGIKVIDLHRNCNTIKYKGLCPFNKIVIALPTEELETQFKHGLVFMMSDLDQKHHPEKTHFVAFILHKYFTRKNFKLN